MAGGFYVHRALKYVIHQHNKSIDNNNNDNNNDNNNNNDNDNIDNNNSNNKMEPKTIKGIYVFTSTLGLHFPSSFVRNRQIFIDNGHSSCMP